MRSLRKYLIILAFATLGVVVYFLAPPSRTVIRLTPSLELQNDIETFSDSGVTGKSWVRMKHKDSPIEAELYLDAPAEKNSWAGFGWLLRESNWSFMDTLYVEVRAQGFDELQFKILTFDPDHTDRKNRSSYRQLNKEIPVSREWQTICIPTNDFYIPDWWYKQQGVDPILNSKHLESVYRLDVQPSEQAARFVPLQLEIRSMTAVGASSRNTAILLGYLFILMITTLGTNPNKRSSQ
jgi:hypothetical protein